MANKHEMMIEGRGRGKKRKMKTTKKGSVVKRQMRTWKRQAWNVLGGVGFITVALVLFWLIRGGGF